MTDQLDIHGNSQPLTWDGEPVYSAETVREGLFDPAAFEQMPGQLSTDDDIYHDRFNMHSASIRCPSCES